MFSSVLGWKAGPKNGKPWMWSQWVCPMKRWTRRGWGADCRRGWPSSRAPVPQSRTMIVPSSVRTSTHAVLPPYLAVRSPGTAMDPRVPQKRTNKDYPPFRRRGCRRVKKYRIVLEYLTANQQKSRSWPDMLFLVKAKPCETGSREQKAGCDMMTELSYSSYGYPLSPACLFMDALLCHYLRLCSRGH